MSRKTRFVIEPHPVVAALMLGALFSAAMALPRAPRMAAAVAPRLASTASALRTFGPRMQSTAAMDTRASFDSLDTAGIFSKFELVKTEAVDERGLTASLYRHVATGAEVLSVDAKDDNKVFSCNLRTLPKDDTGVPHILEHSVLCGSRKYPVKEPFVELLKGSLKTFLNAMTAPDKTMYPVASQNKQDFYNLVSVYLDACLHPRVLDPEQGPQILKQEGWHYEVTDVSAPLKYKGVVFNEMKGVYSSADQLHYRALKKALFQGHPIYAIDSGGDPRAIPTLTYEQFKAFHDQYYHPSNARLYFYADEEELPVAQRLALLEQWLGEFEANEEAMKESIPWHQLVEQPYEVTEAYPVDPNATVAPTQFVSLGWLFPPTVLDSKTKLAWGVLNHLLLGTASSALQKPLLESKLGASVVGGGYGSSLQQASFQIGLKGVATGEESKQQVQDLILSTLEKIVEEGFEDSAVEASMNTVEFRLRATSASPMKGLSFLMGALSEWTYGRDPIDPLRFEKPLADLKAEVAANGAAPFVALLQDYVLANKHRVTLSLVPDPTLGAALIEAEEAELAKAKASLTEEDMARLKDETSALRAAQAAHDPPEALATLPMLSTEDLDRTSRPIPIEASTLSVGSGTDVGQATLLTHELPTDGLVYLNVGLDLMKGSRVALEDMPYLPLLTRMMSELGTKERDEVAFSRLVGSQTGGLGISSFTSSVPGSGGKAGDPAQMVAYLMLSGKSTVDKAPRLMELAAEMLTSIDLDRRDRAIEMLKQGVSRGEAAVISSGNSYASSLLASKFSLCGHVDELMGGISQLETMRAALKEAQDDWPSLLARLERVRASLLTADGAIVNLSADGASLAQSVELVPSLLAKLPSTAPTGGGDGDGWSWSEGGGVLVPTSYEGLQVPTQVNYVAKARPIFAPGERITGATSVVARYLSTAYLWDAVRVQGGAYGCSLGFSRFDGRATFSSYRDPNVAATLDNYDGTAAFLRANPLGPAELSKAVIGAVGGLDAPMAVDTRGFTSMVRHVLGVTEEERQVWRDEVIGTTAADFLEFADRIEAVAESGSVAVVASERAIGEANEALPQGKQLTARQVL